VEELRKSRTIETLLHAGEAKQLVRQAPNPGFSAAAVESAGLSCPFVHKGVAAGYPWVSSVTVPGSSPSASARS
jgi:hypothetical protein